MNAEALKRLSGFTGTSQYFHNNIPRFVYTDGVKFLAENADAYWLLGEIGLAQNMPIVKNDESLRQMQFWTLEPSATGATLKCERDIGDVAYTKEISYTDFPFQAVGGKAQIWVAPTEMRGKLVQVAYLPSEH